MTTLSLLLTLLSAVFAQAAPKTAAMSFELRTGKSGQNVFLASELTEWKVDPLPHLSMRLREAEPGVYRLELPEPWIRYFEYKLVVDGEWRADPANPLSVPDGHGGRNSVKSVESFRDDPWLKQLKPGVPEWQLWRFELKDLEGDTREIFVAAPPESARARFAEKPRVALYFQDGGDYLERAGIRTLIANLSALPDAPLFTAVLIPPKDRMREYDMNDVYARFVARTVVPEIEKRFKTGGAPERRLLVGASMGGLITAYTALHYNDVFEQAASQSGSFWLHDEKLVPELAASRELRLKLFVDVGLYEDGDMIVSNRHARDALKSAGHEVRYAEYPSRHDWTAWRNRLREILRHFFARIGT